MARRISSVTERKREQMSPDFVRYTPEIETIDPDIDELTGADHRLLGDRRSVNRRRPRAPGEPSAARTRSHFGVVKADVEFLGRRTRGLRAGHLRQAGPPRRPDSLLQRQQPSRRRRAARRGSAASRSRSSTSTGPKLVEDEPDSQHVRPRAQEQPDLHRQHGEALSGHPGDRRRRPEYLARGKAGFRELLTDFLTGQGHARASRTGPGTSCSRS